MGRAQRLPVRLPIDQETKLPNLRRHGYKVTSPISGLYNCIAHAAGDNKRKWQNGLNSFPGYYWPRGAIHDSFIEGLESAFTVLGYVRCDNQDLEQGYEKVALFADDNRFWTHAAKQLSNGFWSSKLGDFYDIRHKTPHSVSGKEYGRVVCYMKRRKRA